MKTLDLFIVTLETLIKDTITTSSGMELYIDTRFNEFENRVTEGEVTASPIKYDTGVKVGDTLYFHHLVVLNNGQPLTGEDKSYVVRFDPSGSINNQAIAYKSKETGEVIPFCGWSLLEPIEEEAEEPMGTIHVVNLKEDPVLKGVVSFDTEELAEIGVSKGDTVGFQKNMDYRISIDGKEYYRVHTERILYKEV